MASAFGHAAAAGALGTAFYRPGSGARFWVLGVACSIVPDADVIGVPLGIPFGSVLGHRGLTHSLLFAAGLAAAVAALAFRHPPDGVTPARLWLYFFLATASHGVLDALTDGGPGIAFFAPLDNDRYFLPARPIVVSPLGIRPFFSAWGLRVIESEVVWIGLPALVLAAVATIARRRLNRR